MSIKYRKSYPKDDRDYDITSYDSEYGGVVSNFTSSIYDDNPPLYPNPESLSRNQGTHLNFSHTQQVSSYTWINVNSCLFENECVI